MSSPTEGAGTVGLGDGDGDGLGVGRVVGGLVDVATGGEVLLAGEVVLGAAVGAADEGRVAPCVALAEAVGDAEDDGTPLGPGVTGGLCDAVADA